jgi:hypothetical protein
VVAREVSRDRSHMMEAGKLHATTCAGLAGRPFEAKVLSTTTTRVASVTVVSAVGIAGITIVVAGRL